MDRKKILILASRPLAHDGMTKIEMDVYHTFHNEADFEFASGFDFNNEYGDELKHDGIPLHKLSPKNHVLNYMRDIKNLVSKERYDVVYIHGNSAMMFFDAYPAKLGGCKRVVTHCHNTRSNYPAVHYILKPIFNKTVDIKIGCSQLAAKWAYCGRNIYVIPNGIDVEKMRFDPDRRKEIRQELNLFDDEVLIGHVGRFIDQKNHGRLIDIFKKYHESNLKSKLLLIGDGDLKEDIVKKIKAANLQDHVIILSHTESVQDYYSAMDIMVLPSLFEGLCLVAIEAQANGLPVLIDTFFPQETSVTDNCKRLKLSVSDDVWANMIDKMLKQGRKDVASQIYANKMDQSDMMKSIHDLII